MTGDHPHRSARHELAQPWRGVVASVAVIAVALLAILPWDYATLGGVVADVMMCAIPFAVVVGSFWHSAEPNGIGRLRQPWKGLAYLGLAAVVAVVVHVVLAATIGGGRGDTPVLAFGIILSVVITFWLAVVWGGWPFTLIANRVLGGLVLLATAYVVTAIVLRTLSFAFLGSGPAVAGLDPAGPVPAWDGLVFAVTCLAVIFGLLHFDLWPLTLIPGVMWQPVLGLVWSLATLLVGGAAYLLGTRVLGMSPDTFMVTVPVPFMFGTVVLLTMLDGSLTTRLTGPVKGLVSAGLAAVIGTGLARLYVALMPVLTPDVPAPTAAAGALDQHLWLATALLAVTFPLLAMYKDFFGLWPLARGAEQIAAAPDRADPPPTADLSESQPVHTG